MERRVIKNCFDIVCVPVPSKNRPGLSDAGFAAWDEGPPGEIQQAYWVRVVSAG